MKSASPALNAAQPTAFPPPAPADIDRLGYLRACIEENSLRMASAVADEKALTEKLLAHYAHAPADAILTATGERYLLNLAMRSEEQQLQGVAAKAKVLKWMGRDAFLAACKVTFEILKANLTSQQYAQVVKKERTGRRVLNVVPLTAPPA